MQLYTFAVHSWCLYSLALSYCLSLWTGIGLWHLTTIKQHLSSFSASCGWVFTTPSQQFMVTVPIHTSKDFSRCSGVIQTFLMQLEECLCMIKRHRGHMGHSPHTQSTRMSICKMVLNHRMEVISPHKMLAFKECLDKISGIVFRKVEILQVALELLLGKDID